MRFKPTTWILVATLAAVAAYYFFVEERSRAAKERARLESTKLFLYEMKDLAGFTLINPQRERIEVEHDGDDWRIVAPVASPGDVPTITAFIGQVVPGRRGAKIDKPGNPADYGLVDPFATLIIRRAGAAPRDALRRRQDADELQQLRSYRRLRPRAHLERDHAQRDEQESLPPP